MHDLTFPVINIFNFYSFLIRSQPSKLSLTPPPPIPFHLTIPLAPSTMVLLLFMGGTWEVQAGGTLQFLRPPGSPCWWMGLGPRGLCSTTLQGYSASPWWTWLPIVPGSRSPLTWMKASTSSRLQTSRLKITGTRSVNGWRWGGYC